MKIIAAGSLDVFTENVKHLCRHGYRPEVLILPSEKDVQSLKSKLKHLKIPIWVTNNIHSLAKDIRSIKPDLLICLAYPEILKSSIIKIPKKGVINLHTSLLPLYRGRHPVNWTMINGEKMIGVTVHYINEKIDEGDIIIQDILKIERDEDRSQLDKKLLQCGKKSLLTAVKQIDKDCAYHRKQLMEFGSYLPKRTPDQSRIDWSKNSDQLTNFVNALVDPIPNAFCYRKSQKIHFKRAYRGKNAAEVLAETKDGHYVVSTNDGVVLVKADKKLRVGDTLT